MAGSGRDSTLAVWGGPGAGGSKGQAESSETKSYVMGSDGASSSIGLGACSLVATSGGSRADAGHSGIGATERIVSGDFDSPSLFDGLADDP